MQDECKKRERTCNTEPRCPYLDYCPFQTDDSPRRWNLTDPPRFNEAQLALLKVFYDRGFRKVMTGSTRDALVDCIREFLGIGEDVTLDLAELLGKDGT